MIIMKLRLLILTFIFPFIAYGQQPCKVLLPELDSLYLGECKNGLAEGYGEAWGKFYYKGRFTKGYPQGEGREEFHDTVYIGHWKKGLKQGNGTIYIKENGKVVEKKGLWENDVMQKLVIPPAYKVITQRNLNRVRIYKQSIGDYIWFFPNSTGGLSTEFQDIHLNGSSGTVTSMFPKIGYENVVFPFSGSIQYLAWNKMRTVQFEIFLEIEIYEAGTWVVEIQN